LRLLRTVDDLTDDEVDQVLRRAEVLSIGGAPTQNRSVVVGLLFFEPSLRTRVGFATAAARLGWDAVDITGPRSTSPEFAESWEDTVRVVSAYCDVLVARPGRPLTDPTAPAPVACALVNAGDTGPAAQHPSQALIDVFAIERLRGPIERLAVAIVGDVGMRSVRSLLSLLSRRRPRQTSVVSHPTYLGRTDVLRPWVTVGADLDAAGSADVIYVAGMPHDSIDIDDRRSMTIDGRFMRTLRHDAVILSPMPVLDEVHRDARRDPRVRFHEQSALAMFVRMAILELALGER
jgi:aspartate carbamoyltransferase catalytic subunit